MTGLAFAMLGLALERILNPRVISDMPVAANKPKQEADKAQGHRRHLPQINLNKRVLVSLIVVLLAMAVFAPAVRGKTLASVFMSYFDLSRRPSAINPGTSYTTTPQPVIPSGSTHTPVIPTEPSSTPAPMIMASPTLTTAATEMMTQPAPTLTPTDPQPVTSILHRGEYPYCIARRFNVDPGELLVLNGLLNRETFYVGTVLQIPQTGKPFPGERMQKVHPAIHTVSRADETLYTIACAFGDVHPEAIVQANSLSMDSVLYVGQQLNIP